jgi:hypothetical protein
LHNLLDEIHFIRGRERRCLIGLDLRTVGYREAQRACHHRSVSAIDVLAHPNLPKT